MRVPRFGLSQLARMAVGFLSRWPDSLELVARWTYAQYTPPTPTRLNCRVELRRRRRCALGFRNSDSFDGFKRFLKTILFISNEQGRGSHGAKAAVAHTKFRPMAPR